MKSKVYIAVIVVFFFIVIVATFEAKIATPDSFTQTDKTPVIEPDYTNLTIPYNIAPMNFNIRNRAQKYIVSIYPSDDKSSAINIASKTGSIAIDQKRWSQLLKSNKGKKIIFSVFSMDSENKWSRHADITNSVSAEPIPQYLSYRYMSPTYSQWRDIRILQQSLETSEIKTICNNFDDSGTCINCHSTVTTGDSTNMTLGFRNKEKGVGTLLYSDGELKRLGTKWGYTSWHPTAKVAAFSMNKVDQFFHSGGKEIRDVVDMDSAIAIYSVKKGEVVKNPCLAEKDYLETYPHFSPDGKYLYFCRAPILWEDRDTVPPKRFKEVKYSLMRISYDVATDKWGEIETVLSAEKTGKSMLIPRVSSDGTQLTFCMCDYGCFPVFQHSSDLYSLDLASGKYSSIDQLNSPYSESWHNYSKCGNWLVYSSKRQGGLLTRSYFSFIDENGKYHKPFVLPQKNPEHYYKNIQTYSVPEFLEHSVEVRPSTLTALIQNQNSGVDIVHAISGATPKTKATSSARLYE